MYYLKDTFVVSLLANSDKSLWSYFISLYLSITKQINYFIMKNPLTNKLRMTPEISTNPNCYLMIKSLVKSVNMRREYEVMRIMISLNISL